MFLGKTAVMILKDVSTSAKLIVRDRSSNLNAINLKNGRCAETEKEILAEMIRIHFPDSTSDDLKQLQAQHHFY